jgi:hypothetical protein
MGLSLVVHNAELYFIDYEYTDNKYLIYNIVNDTVTEVRLQNTNTITADSYEETGAMLSYDDTYNKISVKCNLYEVDELFPPVMENL